MSVANWALLNLDASPYLARNLDAFRKRHPLLAEEIESTRNRVDEYEIASLGSDQFACRIRSDERELYPVEGFADRLQTAYDRARRVKRNGAAFLWLAGAGFGYLASHWLDEIAGDYQQGLLLLENRPELVLMQFALLDSLSLIQSRQVYWAVGDPLAVRAAQLIEEERLFHVPTRQLAILQERIILPDEQANYRAVMNDHNAKAAPRERALQNAQARFYRRMQDPPNLQTGVAWGFANPAAYAHTPLLKSLMNGFEEIGWRQALLETEEGFSTRYRIGEHLVESAPDLLLFCNAPSTQYVLPTIKRPRITVMLDNPRHYCPESLREKLGEMDTVIYMDRAFGDFFSSIENAKSCFIPVYPSIREPGVPREELKTPIVFVGSHTPVAELLENTPVRFQDEIEALGNYQIQHPREDASAAIAACEPSGGTMDQLERLANEFTARLTNRIFKDHAAKIAYYLYAFSNSLKRERIIKPLLNLGLTLYGSPSWARFLGERMADRYRGWLDPAELPHVYASAQICLNIHSLQCPTCLNVRDFDILSVGGVLLSDEVADTRAGILEPEIELIPFATPQEARDRAKALLDDAPRRAALREAGAAAIQKRHHPRHRARAILDAVAANWQT